MAQTAQIQAQPREQLGTRANRRLRASGALPGVIYGHKEAIVPITLPAKEMALHLDHGTHVFSLNLDGRSETVLIKEVQYDHLGKEVIHVDFARVNLDERVEVTVPVELKGESIGEKATAPMPSPIAWRCSASPSCSAKPSTASITMNPSAPCSNPAPTASDLIRQPYNATNISQQQNNQE